MSTAHLDLNCNLESAVEKPIYVILGAPGAGKGTVCHWMSNMHHWYHLETGNLFRQLLQANPNSDLGRLLSCYLPHGELVPDHIVMQQLATWLATFIDNGLLLDGLPRTHNQCIRLDQFLEQRAQSIKKAVYISVPRQQLKARLLSRKICSGCNAIWNDLTNAPQVPGICDWCHAALISRDDDRNDIANKRLEIFDCLYKPVIAYYARQNKLVEVVYTNDMTVQELFVAVHAALIIK